MDTLTSREELSAAAEQRYADALSQGSGGRAHVSQHREQTVRLQGARDSASSKIQARDAEIARLTDQLGDATARIQELARGRRAWCHDFDATDQPLDELAQRAESTKNQRELAR
jgi:chromosome segregation ATPase